jgi:hypothetical protein
LSYFNDISYVGRLWCPELIPDIEKFLPVADISRIWRLGDRPFQALDYGVSQTGHWQQV